MTSKNSKDELLLLITQYGQMKRDWADEYAEALLVEICKRICKLEEKES